MTESVRGKGVVTITVPLGMGFSSQNCLLEYTVYTYFYYFLGCSEAGSPPLVSSLSHSLTFHPEFSSDPITSLSVSEFLTFVITRGGKVYWW